MDVINSTVEKIYELILLHVYQIELQPLPMVYILCIIVHVWMPFIKWPFPASEVALNQFNFQQRSSSCIHFLNSTFSHFNIKFNILCTDLFPFLTLTYVCGRCAMLSSLFQEVTSNSDQKHTAFTFFCLYQSNVWDYNRSSGKLGCFCL